MLKKSLVLGAVALAMSVSVSAKEWKEVRVAIDPTYKPFTFKTADGKPTGFDVDIARPCATSSSASACSSNRPGTA